MGKVNLRLAARWRLEAHLEWCGLDRPDVAQKIGENAVAASVAEFAQLAMQSAPGELGKRRKPLAQIPRERRDLARPRRTRAIHRRLQATLYVFVDRLAIEPHLAGDCRDAHTLPMQFKDHHDLPESDQRRSPPTEGTHHRSSAADRLPQAPPIRSARLGKIQSAHLGSIQSALTSCPASVSCR